VTPIRVAIVGGGCAAVSTAFELTRPEHGGRYAVTLYQLGWRLGGKGASGRGAHGRIEEHGLHVWMGWYENAFRLMRECYAELGRDPATCPIAGWQDAFAPMPALGIAEHEGPAWTSWIARLPPTEGLPGDPRPAAGGATTVRDYMLHGAALLRGLFETLQGTAPSAPGAQRSDGVAEAMARLLRYGELATLGSLVQATALLEAALAAVAGQDDNVLLRFVDAMAANARELLEARLAGDPGARRVWYVADLTLATLRGAIRFGLATDPRGFDAIDEYDCREWLLLNGASAAAVNSGWMRALYDLVFAYEAGDPARPRMSAGQALRGMVRTFFTYRGAFFWRMQAGMGDVVFAPFYEVLRRRGVRFEFFHRLEQVHLAAPHAGEPRYVEALDFDVQADVVAGEYRPLVDVGGLPCWPSVPDWGQLVDGERLRSEGCDFESYWDRRRVRSRTLRVCDDFDLVVLGVGLGAVPHVAAEVVAQDPRWRAMVDHVGTVPTQAFQVWLEADVRELGWPHGAVTLSGFVEPFDTWADMRHLLAREGWRRAPQALAYFCSVLREPEAPLERANATYPAVARGVVRGNAIRFLERDVRHLWPDAVRAPAGFRWELLADGAGSSEERFASQYWTANVNPSDRYVLSLPGSSAYRISPLDRTYDNMTVAGDWTACGFNAGCVEAAVMSGLLAAHAIAGAPALNTIVGYDHP